MSTAIRRAVFVGVTGTVAVWTAGGCGSATSPPATPSTTVYRMNDMPAKPAGAEPAPTRVTNPPPPATAPSPTAASAPPAYILHLPGIGGTRQIDVWMLDGLARGGFKGKQEIVDWTGDDPGIDALKAYDRNRKSAAKIADSLTKTYDAAPADPIDITSHSGGGAMAVWILEDLPPRVKVRDVLLMSPALSPTYDLTKALRHVTGNMYVFSSLGDLAVLGYGCRLLGTMDGQKTDAAGRVGFTRPATADPEQYRKLVPMPYQSDWARKYHNAGDHIGAMEYTFAKGVLAPLLLHQGTGPTTEPAVAGPTVPGPTVPVAR